MKRKLLSELCVDALLLSLLIVGSQISIKIGLTTFTLQLLIVFIISNICDLKNSLIIITCYIIMGLIGIPVFASWGSGISYVISPTFGFVYGFYFVILIQYFVNKLFNKIPKFRILGYFVGSILSLVVLYSIGYLHGYLILNLLNGKGYTLEHLFKLFIVPYIPFDICKLTISSLVSERLSFLLHKYLSYSQYETKAKEQN